MSGTVRFEVTDGKMRGRSFAFETHGILLVGRTQDCHVCLPDDPQVSRHHCIVEANPPDVCVRDLSSLSGTYVNGTKHGGRQPDEGPEAARGREQPTVPLTHGDRIKVGATAMVVSVEVPELCAQCGNSIPADGVPSASSSAGARLCAACTSKGAARYESGPASGPVRCARCQKDIARELPPGQPGDGLCKECRELASEQELQPMHILLRALAEKQRLQRGDEAPGIEGYEVEPRPLCVGGMGTIYRARRTADGRIVVVKVMLSKIAVHEKARKDFLREIESMDLLRHENIVTLLDHGGAGTAFYFVSEFCDGGSVEDLLVGRGGRLGVAESRRIILPALTGLAYAHQHSVVHRDLKPANLLLAGSEAQRTVKICDLGLAKNFANAGFSGMTLTKNQGGTPVFMPREQLTNFKFVKPVSDIWSMGATLYHMLTAKFPYPFRRTEDPYETILNARVVPIRQRDPSIPQALADVIDRAVTEQPADRFQSADEMRHALEQTM